MGEHAQSISAKTRICAVFGHPVKHSASPAMQNAGMAALGVDWKYLAFDVDPASLAEAIKGAQAMKFIGLNLTVPHKLLAMTMVDELDESARRWGAVNTVLFEAQTRSTEWKPLRLCEPDEITAVRSCGFNTDADAISRSIKEDLGLKVQGASVLVLGAGGAGRTAALKLASDHVTRLFLVNRTMTKAEELAREIRERFPSVSVQTGYPNASVDLVLNATSLGLKPADDLPVDLAQFSLMECNAAYDMIYCPVETPFLTRAKKAGCKTANGLGMLLYQGARALEIWSGQAPPIDRMGEALKGYLYGK
jgi:shikimate dehydrogenase